MMNRQMWQILAAALAVIVAGCLLVLLGGWIGESHFTTFLLTYLALGVVFFVLLSILYRRIGLEGRWAWFAIFTVDSIWLIAIWPIAALVSLLCWGCEVFHITSKQKDAKRREEEARRATRFSHMSLDELLSEQRKVLGATERRE